MSWRKRPKTPAEKGDHKSVAYEIFILLVSVVSLVNLVVAALNVMSAAISGPTDQVVNVMDLALTPVFAFDFVYRLATSKSRRRYLLRHSGWIDLLAIAPWLRVLRTIRIAEQVRWMRRLGIQDIATEISETRATATFLFTIFLVFVVVEVAGVTIYIVEGTDPAANIHSASDAIWWGLVTITTVGYGDKYPVTNEGRVVGVFLLFAGIALFSVLTGFIANVFLAPHRRPFRRVQQSDTRKAIHSMRSLLEDQEARGEEIKQRLDELERSLSPSAPVDQPEPGVVHAP